MQSNTDSLFRAIYNHRLIRAKVFQARSPSQGALVCCREITAADVDKVIDLLTEGFRAWRDRVFWMSALARLSKHPTPAGFPKYGYMLENEGVPVGVLLLIFVSIKHGGEERVRCNVSSWYVKTNFRLYGSLLALRAQRHKQATYFNLTPAPWTLNILEAQGYKQYCKGAFIALPLLSSKSEPVTIERVVDGLSPDEHLSAVEIDLMVQHAAYGCLSLVCNTSHGRQPFVFALLHRFRIFKYAVLMYSRNLDAFIHLANSLGRFLVKYGVSIVVLNANGPVEGLIGVYSGKYPKYFKGEHLPDLADLAFSERAMFEI